MYQLIRPLLFNLSPETAHRAVLYLLRVAGRFAASSQGSHVARQVRLLGLTFPNRVGLAAGFDKNAEAIDGLWQLGFGFVEIGTVTPRPQSGQPQPRMFRLPDRHALINRLGFPNDGVEKVVERLRNRRKGAGIVGVNIGKNAATPLEQAVDDYVAALRVAAPVADYIAINISSPNTQSLRELHVRQRLVPLLSTLISVRDSEFGGRPPLLLKISPDLADQTLDEVIDAVREVGIDGVIATNTTANSDPVGGLSGRPLHSIACSAVARVRARAGPDFPIIGVGGIESAATARAMLAAGANLIQIYTGLVYRGPHLVRECLGGLG